MNFKPGASGFVCAYRNKTIGTSLLAMCLLMSAVAAAQQADDECRCRAPDGTMRKQGAVECVDIVGTRSLLRCEMSTNTPYWKPVKGVEGCPDA